MLITTHILTKNISFNKMSNYTQDFYARLKPVSVQLGVPVLVVEER